MLIMKLPTVKFSTSSFPSLKKSLLIASLASGLLAVSQAEATTVQFQTVLGDIEVNLFDKATPETVKNFLSYVNARDYSNTIIHRSVPGFIIQGGGYMYSGALPLENVAERPAVINEPVYSNLRGTIAMAKLGSDPDSATSEWFFNLSDNSANLDVQNEGFTVFGQVANEEDMAIIDAIAALPRFNMGGAFNTLPLRDYTAEDFNEGVPADGDSLVIIQDIVVLDASPDTADDLNPTENTLIDSGSSSSSSSSSAGNLDNSGGSSGGSLGLLSLLMLGVLAFTRKRVLHRG